MKLKSKWKFVAKDEGGGVYVYTHKPTRKGDCWYQSIVGYEQEDVTDLFDLDCPWTESLHEILPDGSLRKVIPRKKVKPLKELVHTLLDEGYLPDKEGDWHHECNSSKYPTFLRDMFESAGKEQFTKYTYRTSWLTDD